MDGYEAYSATKLLARVMSGFKGEGPNFNSMVLTPKHTFVDGNPATVAAQFGAQSIKQQAAGSTYSERKGK